MLRIAYRSDAATMQRGQLLAWCQAVAAAGMESVTPPGAVVTLTPPSLPWAFESSPVATDRSTQGGASYSIIHYTARQGVWNFSDVPDPEVADWRAWHAATLGGRLPFVIGFREARHVVVAPGAFPLMMTRAEKWAGQLTVQETLG